MHDFSIYTSKCHFSINVGFELCTFVGFHMMSWQPCLIPITKHSSIAFLACTNNMDAASLNPQGLITNQQSLHQNEHTRSTGGYGAI